MGIEGVLQQGFVTTTADKLINWTRTGSLWPVTFGLAGFFAMMLFLAILIVGFVYEWMRGALEWE